MSELERWTAIRRPAHDCIEVQPCKFGSDRCKPGEGGSHGRHSVELVWYVGGEGPDGYAVVQFLCYTGWMLDETPERAWGYAMAADLGYHWPVPRYEGQEEYGRMDCDLLPEGKCFYDGSGLNAEGPWRAMRYEGDDAFWASLESYWYDLAGGAS